jgi:hypothetical protein
LQPDDGAGLFNDDGAWSEHGVLDADFAARVDERQMQRAGEPELGDIFPPLDV